MTPDTAAFAASIAAPEAVLICDCCERRVYRLHHHPDGSAVCDDCLEALTNG